MDLEKEHILTDGNNEYRGVISTIVHRLYDTITEFDEKGDAWYFSSTRKEADKQEWRLWVYIGNLTEKELEQVTYERLIQELIEQGYTLYELNKVVFPALI